MTTKIWTNCWRWDCETCGKIMRMQWARHLIQVTKGQQLYLVSAQKWAWGDILGQLIKAQAEYVKCDMSDWTKHGFWEGFIIITNKPIDNSQSIRAKNREAVIKWHVMKSYDWHRLISPIHASKVWRIPGDKLSEYIEEI
jgi:hypothetical protein